VCVCVCVCVREREREREREIQINYISGLVFVELKIFIHYSLSRNYPIKTHSFRLVVSIRVE
jgi:hypothetical protein